MLFLFKNELVISLHKLGNRHPAWGGISLCPGAGGPARYLQLHLHQEDSVMVGEDLVYSLTVTLL